MKAETIQAVLDFRDQRDWRQFHTPKDLALSIVLEAAELLEVFQWSGSDVRCAGRDARVREELADVLCYCISMADIYGFDLDEIILEKLAKNEAKYPADLVRGSKEKYTAYQQGGSGRTCTCPPQPTP